VSAYPVIAAGWYQDPEDQTMVRWWDGAGWTDHRQAHPDHQPPSLAVPSAPDPAVAPAASVPMTAEPTVSAPIAPAPAFSPEAAASAPALEMPAPMASMAPAPQPAPMAPDLMSVPAPIAVPSPYASVPGPIAPPSPDVAGIGGFEVPAVHVDWNSSPGPEGTAPSMAAHLSGDPSASGPDASESKSARKPNTRLLILLGVLVVVVAAGGAYYLLGSSDGAPADSSVSASGGKTATPAPTDGTAAPGGATDSAPVPPGAGTDASKVPADASGASKATANIKAAQTELESCAASNPDGSFTGCQGKVAKQEGVTVKVSNPADSYTISAKDGKTTFTAVNTKGDVKRTCAPAGTAGCAAGTW
jgi:hypothetical protein